MTGNKIVATPAAEAVMDAIAAGADADGPSVVTDMLLDEDCEEGEEYNDVTNKVMRELRRGNEDDGGKFEAEDGDGGVIDDEEDGGGAMMMAEGRKTTTTAVVDQIEEAARRSSLSFLSTLSSSCLSSSRPPRSCRPSLLILRAGARHGGGRGGRTPEPQRDPRDVRSPGSSSLRRKKI
jgi:hypothetical protein